MDYQDAANRLRVVDVWKPNETGWVTPKVLYDPSVLAADGKPKAPHMGVWKQWVDHGTVGVATLRFWGEGGSAVPGAWSLAQYLIPRDTTVYKDNKTHDTTWVVFKMVPDGFACNHTGVCISPFGNSTARGMEYESRQNGAHDITDMQYLKGALVTAFDLSLYHIPDWMRQAHGIIALPWGRRSDPWAGRFSIARSWQMIEELRAAWPVGWPALWRA